MSDKLTIVQAFHERADIVQAVQAFNEIVNRVIAKAINSEIHSDDRVLLILTETDPDSGYGYDENDSSYPHSADGRLIMPFGKNEKGQKQFLVSFDPTGCDDKTHPDPSVPPGWDWEVYKLQQAEQVEMEQAEPEQTDLLNIDFIVKHKELIAQLLEVAADQFANHGCNEFDLTDCLPDRVDQHKLAKTIFDEDDPDEYSPETDYSVMHDYRLMDFFADKIRKLRTDI